MANIFISYNRQSKTAAVALVQDVEALGHTVWFDQELSGGQAWWDQILSMIRRCDVFVFVLDPAALKSTACKLEWGYAADLRKPILPILVSKDVSEHGLPPALAKLQFVDYRNQDRTAAFCLARAFNTLPPPADLPDPLPVPPEVPLSYLSDLTERVEKKSDLTLQEQTGLLFELKRGLRDLETADETRTLLKTFRKRRDLFAAIAEEIDELNPRREKPREPELEPQKERRPVPEPPQDIAPLPTPPSVSPAMPSASVREDGLEKEKKRRLVPRSLIWAGICVAIIAVGLGVNALRMRGGSISGLNPSVLVLANFVSTGLLLGVYHQASRRCDYGLFIAVVGLTTLIVIVPFFLWEAYQQPAILDFVYRPIGDWSGYWILLIILILGALYAVYSYSRLRISEVLPTYVHLPLQRLQLLFVVIGAFLYFKESQPPQKLFGIAIAFVPIVISLVRRSGAGPLNATVRALPIFWLAVVVVLGGFLQLSSKWALNKDYIAVPALSFVILTNMGTSLVSIGGNLFSSVKVKEARMTIALGLLGGLLNVFAFVTLTEYLVKGDASIIFPVSAMAFLIPTALYQLWGTEAAPSKLDWVAYSCAVFAVIMLAG